MFVGWLIGCSFVITGVAHAEVRTTAMQMRQVEPPADVSIDARTDPTSIIIFDETQDVELPWAVSAVTQMDAEGATRVTIPAGTVVDSHLIHADLPGTDMSATLPGSVAFVDPIVGLVIDAEELIRTDDVLGYSETIYGTDPDRRADEGVDLATITGYGGVDRSRVVVELSVDFGLDHIRVLTSPGAVVDADASIAGADPPAGFTFSGGGGCGCSSAGTDDEGPSPLAFLGLPILFLAGRRRRPAAVTRSSPGRATL
jgi:MYXO-CTERM domain-containing protein